MYSFPHQNVHFFIRKYYFGNESKISPHNRICSPQMLSVAPLTNIWCERGLRSMNPFCTLSTVRFLLCTVGQFRENFCTNMLCPYIECRLPRNWKINTWRSVEKQVVIVWKPYRHFFLLLNIIHAKYYEEALTESTYALQVFYLKKDLDHDHDQWSCPFSWSVGYSGKWYPWCFGNSFIMKFDRQVQEGLLWEATYWTPNEQQRSK